MEGVGVPVGDAPVEAEPVPDGLRDDVPEDVIVMELLLVLLGVREGVPLRLGVTVLLGVLLGDPL